MAVEVATANFVERGEIIAQENIEAQQDIMSILEDIRGHGKSLVLSSRDFAEDPCSTVKRSLMVKAAQDLEHKRLWLLQTETNQERSRREARPMTHLDWGRSLLMLRARWSQALTL